MKPIDDIMQDKRDTYERPAPFVEGVVMLMPMYRFMNHWDLDDGIFGVCYENILNVLRQNNFHRWEKV